MVLVNIDIPETCRECPMSFQYIGINRDAQRIERQILCRVDWRQHEPMDDCCPIMEQQDDYTDEPWVRCKDCKYLNRDVIAKGKILSGCDKLYDELGCEQDVEPDDFL